MKDLMEKWRMPLLAFFITLIFLGMMGFVHDSAMATVRNWHWEPEYWTVGVQIQRYINNALLTVFWVTVISVLIIPVEKFKKNDQLYKFIPQLPIEAYAIATLIIWTWIANNQVRPISQFIQRTRALFHVRLTNVQNIRVLAFLALVFLAICLLGYTVLFLKDIYMQKSGKNHSLSWRLIGGQFTADLKMNPTLKIAFVVFGLPVIGFILFLFGYETTRTPEFGLLLILGYLVAIFLFARNRVIKIRKDYLRLLEISEQLAAGNFAIDDTDDLGPFESVKTELSTVQHGFSHAVERALSSERMKGELITNVSHDLKTPLTSIITYIDLLQKADISDEKRNEYIKTLELKTDRLKTLIEDLFEVSKASSGNLQLEVSEVNIETLLKQTILGLDDRIAESGIQLRETYPEEGVKLQLDGARMHRVFENLIINIVKYALPGTRAYIDVLSSDDSVQIIFRNISSQEINHDALELSQRFVRGEESRTTDGSGLGLAIAKSFTELQGGYFSIAIDADLFKVILSFNK